MSDYNIPNLPCWEQPLQAIYQDGQDIVKDWQARQAELYQLERNLTAEQRRRMEQTQQH